ncbi:MAG: glycerophosphodiester phosphodiesterase family protein [Alphaproteobacteria bacterium]
MLKLPKVIGHRGAAGYAPENTLVGIHTAADMGVEWVELDVKLTRDQIPVIFHDETLERTTGTQGNIADLDMKDLRELDAGSWFGSSFIGLKIPTLEEVVDVLIERNLGLNLELKPCPGRERETTEVALDLLSHIWDDHDRLLISSFQHVSLETAQDLAADWKRGLLLPKEWPENWAELAEYLDVATINVSGNHITREQLEDALELELPVLAYTINDPIRARELQNWGVDSFFSDTPDVILENLLTVH